MPAMKTTKKAFFKLLQKAATQVSPSLESLANVAIQLGLTHFSTHFGTQISAPK
jgi:hypothetical protein